MSRWDLGFSNAFPVNKTILILSECRRFLFSERVTWIVIEESMKAAEVWKLLEEKIGGGDGR